MATSTAVRNPQGDQVDLSALKTRQHGAWSSGDYAVVGTTLQIVGEELCEALDLRAGQKVIDVAAGNGNATLAAARRWCDVMSTDYVPSLLERGRARAAAEGLSVQFKEADAEALAFGDGTFDTVISTFGVMFTPDQDRAASELLRVCKSGGKIGLLVRLLGGGGLQGCHGHDCLLGMTRPRRSRPSCRYGCARLCRLALRAP